MPQRAHYTRNNSATMTDPPHYTRETLTHKNRLLQQQSNLQAWRLSINDYSILLVQSSYPGGTYKSPAIDCTAFDYIHWVKKMPNGHYSECKWGWRPRILKNQCIFCPGFVVCSLCRQGLICLHVIVAFPFSLFREKPNTDDTKEEMTVFLTAY